MSVVNCPNPLTRRREYLRSPIARKVGGPLKAMSFLMSTQAGFSPADIASLAHWYDATAISGSDGDAIGTWTDQEGTDDLTQATSSKKPALKANIIGGNQIVRFDGSDDFLDVAFGSNVTQANHVFAVFQLRSADTGAVRTMYDGATADEQFFRADQNNNFEIFAGTQLTGGGDDTNNHILTALYNSTSSLFRLDATQKASGNAGTNDMTGLTVGARGNDSLHGPFDIGELLVYDADLSDSDRDDVESYLSDKWGVAI